MPLDLGNAADFATATMGSVGGVLQTLSLAGRDPSQWDILEASYNGVLIHVFQSKSPYGAALPTINDRGGRRKVRYQFPYRDGQTTDDLGRKPESFEMDILLFGAKYTQGLSQLFTEFDKATPGVLVHPIRGQITVVVTDYEILHTYEKRKAAEIRVTFEEHNFTIGSFRVTKDKSVKGLISQALAALTLIENAVLQVTGATKFVRSLVVQVLAALGEYNTGYAKLLTQMNTTFNSTGSSDIPSLLPVNQGGNRNADGSLASSNFPVVGSVVQNAAQLSAQTATALAVVNLEKQTNALRSQVAALIAQLKALDALYFFQNIQDLKTTAILMQNVLEAGIASSNTRVIAYTTPRLMSIREVAFANNVPLSRLADLAVLNPDVPSYNYLPEGTVLQVVVNT